MFGKSKFQIERSQRIVDGTCKEDQMYLSESTGSIMYRSTFYFDTADLKEIIELLQEKYEEINNI